MDLWARTDQYCERLDLTFWAEPLNAVTNLSFLVAALWMLARSRDMGPGRRMARLLAWILFVLAFGSFAFHTFATTWAMLADVLPILAFVLVYVFAIGRDVMGQGAVKAGLLVVAFLGFAALTGPAFAGLDWIGSSAGYMPIPAFLAGLIWWVNGRHPATARALGLGLGLMLVSLTLRTLDEPLCGHWPHGTHFAWHLINGAMLGWFIETYRRHMLAAPRGGV